MSSTRLRRGTYVIPKQRFRGSRIPFYPFDRSFNSFSKDAPSMGYIDLDISEYDIPIWYITDILSDTRVIVQTTYYYPKYKYGDFMGIDVDNLTNFVVTLKADAPTDGALQDPSHKRVGVVVATTDEWEPADDMIFYVQDKLSKNVSAYDKSVLTLVDVSALKEQARGVRDLLMVSKQGFLPSHVPSIANQIVSSQLTGVSESYSPRSTLRKLRNEFEGPRHEYNIALRDRSLPYGPTERNFMGGNYSGAKGRKSRDTLETTMARRGSRSSRGIFSRLYSPIGHLLSAGKESVGAVTNTAKGVVGEGIHGLDKIGRSVTKHTNMAVRDVFSRKRKGGKRRARGTRKSRKSKTNTRRRR